MRALAHGIGLTAALLALTIAGCATAPGENIPQFEGEWTLTSGADAAGALELDPSHPVTLIFGGTTGTGGTAACNSYGAEIVVRTDGITVSNVSQTEMACEPASVMELESRYLAALAAVTSGNDGNGDELTLRGPDVELVFAPVVNESAIPLVGTDWTLVSLVENPAPDAAMSGPVGDVTFTLRDDGVFTMQTDCNGAGGGYSLIGHTVTPTEVASTLIGCDTALAEQDALLYRLVSAEFDVQQPETLNRAQLILTSRDGSIEASFTALP